MGMIGGSMMQWKIEQEGTGMVSRRKFFAVFLMMAMLLFLFQFSQVMRESWNHYTNNEYASADLPTADMAWTEEQTSNIRGGLVPNVLYVGDEYDSIGDIVTQWCLYKKYKLRYAMSLTRFSAVADVPSILLIDGAKVGVEDYLHNLDAYLRYGVTVVFVRLPDVDTIKSSPRLQEILSITEIPSDRVKVEGIRLFDGFLLGGEAYYLAQNEKEEEELQDLKLEMPWYVTGEGSKTYMVGLMNEKVYERERFPRVLWRSSTTGNMVFAVNGNYMEDETGLGLLDLFLYEASDYVLYPVVNAQNTLLVDFPDFSGADAGAMTELYSRDAQAIQQDIFWPSIYSMITKNQITPTCFFASQYDAEVTPQAGLNQVNFYLQQVNEVGAEAGRSLNYGDNMSLAQKILKDSEYYQDIGCEYNFRAAYLKEVDYGIQDAWEEEAGQTGLTTVAADGTDRFDVVSYFTDTVTLQGITHRADEYSYAKNLRTRSLLTSLGYTNMLVDFHRVLWPQDKEDSWEIYFDKVYSNISTYWTHFMMYDQTTLSQSDARIRTFLNLNYIQQGNNNNGQILLVVNNGGDDCWFLLRTHGKKISSLEHGTYQMLERDAYLIHVLDSRVTIRLDEADEILEYKGPFGR